MPTRRVKRQPQRTCIACQRTDSKRQLVRLVRRPDGDVVVDAMGKLAGRGAYLCARRSCWEAALAQRRIDRALKTTLKAEQRARLDEYAQQLPEQDEPAVEDVSTPSIA